MSGAIGTTPISQIITKVVVTVGQSTKMEKLAETFEEQDINAAPVVDSQGSCIGIISSHDLVEYESKRKAFQNEMKHGSNFNLAHYGDGSQLRWPGKHFDEVGFHMSRSVVTAEMHYPVSRVARAMCENHIHHVIVLDSEKRPVGMISTLDILGFILGEPVARHPNQRSQ